MKAARIENKEKRYCLSEAADSMQGAILTDRMVDGYWIGFDEAWAYIEKRFKLI